MNDGRRILLVEDEPAIADTLVYALKTEGFSTEWCTTGRAALAAVAAQPFALVVLDVGLPDGSGFDVCKELRTRSAVPVIFLTARSSELDRVLGLELGGDDYLTKPFSPRELTARVKAILRRTAPVRAQTECHLLNDTSAQANPASAPAAGPGPECHVLSDARPHVPPAADQKCHLIDDTWSAPEFVVDEERCAIAFRGVRLELTRYEFRLLKALVAKPGRVFSREQLMAAAWEDPDASLDRTVDAHIKTVRAKLRAVDADADPIVTHRGLGYSLRASG